jgi:hypothetical protein
MREDLVLAGWLGLAAGIATVLVFPYLLDTMPALRARSPIPLPALADAGRLPGEVGKMRRPGRPRKEES